MAPTLGNGKICYIELPARDPQVSSAFYAAVFGWEIRTRHDGSLAFDDGVHQVSGTWTASREPMQQDATNIGPIVYIMVDDAEATIARVRQHGGSIVQPIGRHYPEITAFFRDPGGNVLGIYQEGGRQRAEQAEQQAR